MTDPEIIPPEVKPKRPAEFTDELFDLICERMMGGEWLRKICDNDPQMPSRQTFLRWIEKDTGRQEKYARASRAMVDYWAEELLEISQETEKDTIVEPNGRRKCNHEWVANKRLHSENLRFLMSKIYPKRYGDKVPEVEAERDLKISWDNSAAKDVPHKIQRVIVSGVEAGNHLQKRIRELEEQLAEARGEKPAEPPKLLTFDPGPVPTRLHGQITTRLVDIIKSKVPDAGNRDPASVLDEVMGIIDQALWAKYGYEQFEPDSSTPDAAA